MMILIRKILRLERRRQLHTIISREIIKPSSPTPPHLQTYNLSELDLCSRHVYMPLTLFYPKNEICGLTNDDKARIMKESLSQCLKKYYPLAGRLHEPTAPNIDCNDEGVVFVEAKNNTKMTMLEHVSIDNDTVGQLFVDGMFWPNSPHSENIVGVKLNHFACGGIAVAVSMSHRIGDACTLGSFVRHWASVARFGSTQHKEVLPLNPHFIQSPSTSSILLPQSNSVLDASRVNLATRKFMFSNSKLSDLKNKVLALAKGGSRLFINNNPTRVEVLTSLIYKTAVAATTPRTSSFNPMFLVMMVDLRKKFVPNQPQTAVGNLITGMMVTTRHESETSLSLLVSEIKKQKMELQRFQSLQLACQSNDIILSRLRNEELENVANRIFWCSSLCGFGYNKVDFGWGDPTVASITYRSAKHTGSVLMDAPNGDGIEAWVTLETQDMERFQSDKELLSFCKN